MNLGKNKNGITLIALVVTIIVLIILAGITIVTLSGHNSLIEKTIDTREEYAMQSIREQLNIRVYDIIADCISKNEEMSLEGIFEKLGAYVDKSEEIDNKYYLEKDSYRFMLIEHADGGYEVVIAREGEDIEQTPGSGNESEGDGDNTDAICLHKNIIEETTATCTESGEKTQTCNDCNNVISREIIEAKGHTPGEYEIKTSATCSEEGKEVQRCVVCNTQIDSRNIPKIDHRYGEDMEKINTLQHGYKCIMCGATKDLSDHTWGTKAYAYDSSTAQYKQYHFVKCTQCSGVKNIDHTQSTVSYSILGSSGHTKSLKCACGVTYKSEQASHSYGGYTNTSAGCKRTCACGYYTTTSHSYTTSVTCYNGAPTATKKCSRCNRCQKCGGTH